MRANFVDRQYLAGGRLDIEREIGRVVGDKVQSVKASVPPPGWRALRLFLDIGSGADRAAFDALLAQSGKGSRLERPSF